MGYEGTKVRPGKAQMNVDLAKFRLEYHKQMNIETDDRYIVGKR